MSEKLDQNYKAENKTILITGATGYLGQNLLKKLMDEDDYAVWVYSRNKEKALNILPEGVMFYYDECDLERGKIYILEI